MQRLRASLGHEGAAVRHTHQVLTVLEEALAEADPTALLAASRHVLEEHEPHGH